MYSVFFYNPSLYPWIGGSVRFWVALTVPGGRFLSVRVLEVEKKSFGGKPHAGSSGGDYRRCPDCPLAAKTVDEAVRQGESL